MRMKKRMAVTALLSWVSVTAVAMAAPDASKLGVTLTPVGAEKDASKDGNVPAWSGGDTTPAGWTVGKNRADAAPYMKEKPLFTITAANVDQYADKLTPGQIAMLKKTAGYEMRVYPTHRTCSYPDFVQKNTKDTVGRSAIGKDGWSIEGAVLPSVPFPMPENGVEAVWNHLIRYTGVGQKYEDMTSALSPRPGSDEWIHYHSEVLFYQPWGKKTPTVISKPDDLMTGVYYQYREPAALNGQAYIGRNYFGTDSESFYYFSGQRRVRRLPAYSYDAPAIGLENQYPVDSYNVFNGLPDRFDWKLVGKQELYVPYNSLALLDDKEKVENVFLPKSVSSSFRRYELHRVWHVRGTVKPGMRHTSPTKDLYLDEDSWIAVVGDDYDSAGNIWRLKEDYIAPIWELGACGLAAYVSNDMVSGRYVIDGSVIGGKPTSYMTDESQDPRLQSNFFTDANLRAISGR